MQDTILANALIETKLYRPSLPVDMVRRPHLTTYLKKRQQSRPLTLVSAPAGYGKSTLVSCWLEFVDCPTAWLSLDEQDNELESFLRYFLAAIQTIFPNALLETENLLSSTSRPTIAAIANSLINEIDQIGEFFILVLDDYHLVEKQSIHDLVNGLLLQSPPNLHLVIATRMDPPLSLVTLRAKGRVTEVRIPSLRFTQEESLRLFKKMTGDSIDEGSIIEIDTKVEGWVTGLRLAALAMRHRVGREVIDRDLNINNRYVSDYLISEILAKQAATLSDCMLKVSIPARFCADLCEALCFQREETPGIMSAESILNGKQFLELLCASNLFVIPLDDQREWFRYHHLFREFLQQELVRRLGHDEIKKLHSATGRWYAQNGWLDEAFYHLIQAGEYSTAVELLAQHRYRMMNETQWPRLENRLHLFPEEIIESSPELWMLKTWLAYHHGRWVELPALLQHLKALLTGDPNQEAEHRLAGEIHALHSLVAYHTNDAEGAISQARLALERLPPDLWIVRVLARLYLSGSLLMTGDEIGSSHTLYSAFEEEQFQGKHFKATLLMTVCNVHWLAADLQSMEQAAKQSIVLCLESDYRQILGHSQNHLGCVHYQQDDLLEAEELFAGVVARPYQNYGTTYVNSVCGLSMIYQALGKEAEAREVTERAIAFLLETGNTTQLPLILALQAELALKQGNLPAASHWAAKLDPVPPLLPMFGFFAPHLTLVRVWLAQNTPTSLAKAGKLLNQVQEYLEGTHNTRFLIETLAMQTLLEQTLGDTPAALAALERALRLAQPGGFIRAFVDAGPGMARVLAQSKVDDDLRDYVERIRSAFPGLHLTQEALNYGELLDPLTDRELQILELLQERLSNKEIATQLVISPGTVKGHTIKIYQKLDVKGRRQAVEKAATLGILALN